MFWLIFCTLSATGIFVMFKILAKTKTPLFNAIIINYLVAASFGFAISDNLNVDAILKSDWLLQSIIIGVLFIVMFFIIGKSSQKVGISITTVASKMSVVIPMVFAIYAFNENFGIIKVIGIVTAVLAVSLSVYKRPDKKGKLNYMLIFLPVILFVGMGIADSTVIYSKEVYVDDQLASLFSAMIFFFALASGVVFSIFKTSIFRNFAVPKVWLNGIILGLFNYGSIYLMIRALNSGVFQNSVVYGITNIGIVSLSVIIGTLFFKEKLSNLNRVGIVLSIFAIGLLTIADYSF